MCRWFAYISPEETCLLSDVLIDPANSISKQCSEHYLPKLLPHGDETELNDSHDKLLQMRNSLLNMDGLGVAWYTSAASNFMKSVKGTRPALYKSQSPPSNDFNFRNICNNTESHCVFAHIRATSGSPVSPINSHPFVFGRHVFMHNGVVSSFTAIRRDMTDLLSYDAYANVIGSTDSEHAAALYMTHLTSHGDKSTWEEKYSIKQMHDAMIHTVLSILELQHKKLGSRKTPNSMNFCASDGHKLVAVRFRNHATQQPPSLYWSEFAGRTLNHKYPGIPDNPGENLEASKGSEEHGKHTIVASEPTTYDEKEWHLIKRNSALLVDENGVETKVPIEYDSRLNAIDPSNL